VLAHGTDVPEHSEDQPKLVFDKDGDEYVLSKLLDPAFDFGIETLRPERRGEPDAKGAPMD
jgi:hypothetical protein